MGEVVRAIYDFVNLKPKRKYKIIIGTDSSARNEVALITAITIWRVGNGGIHFWTKSEVMKFHGLRGRNFKGSNPIHNFGAGAPRALKRRAGRRIFLGRPDSY